MRILQIKTVIGLALAAFFFVGCPSQKSATKQNGGDDDKPPFKQYHSGVSKYDSYFGRVYKLRYKLWKSDRQVAAIPNTLRSVLDAPGDVKDADTGNLLQMIATKYRKDLAFHGNHIRVAAGSTDPKAKKVAETLDKVYQTVYGMPKNLGGSVDESKQLVVRGQRLTKDVPKDFTGFKALKAPAVAAGLADSTKSLAKVPGQVASIGKSSLIVAKQFPAVFRSKKSSK